MKRFIVKRNRDQRCHDVINDETDEVVASFDWDTGLVVAGIKAVVYADRLNYDDSARANAVIDTYDQNGNVQAERIHPQDIVSTFDCQEHWHLLLATTRDGNVYRVHRDDMRRQS